MHSSIYRDYAARVETVEAAQGIAAPVLATVLLGGVPRAVLRSGTGLIDVATATRQPQFASIMGMLEHWSEVQPLLAGLDHHNVKAAPDASAAVFLPPLTGGTIYCVGANYQEHVDNVARFRGLPLEPNPRERGLDPFFFLKSSRSLVGHGAAVPLTSAALDYEIELAAVIGKVTADVTVDNALGAVAGYTIASDMSARDRFVREALTPGSPFRYDWVTHKNFPGACPLGPWLVTAGAVPDPQALTLKTWVNGELRQDDSTSKMIFSTAEQIAYLSRRFTLFPGDVVLTGTPAGVAAEDGRFLRAGDIVRMEISSLGELITTIV